MSRRIVVTPEALAEAIAERVSSLAAEAVRTPPKTAPLATSPRQAPPPATVPPATLWAIADTLTASLSIKSPALKAELEAARASGLSVEELGARARELELLDRQLGSK